MPKVILLPIISTRSRTDPGLPGTGPGQTRRHIDPASADSELYCAASRGIIETRYVQDTTLTDADVEARAESLALAGISEGLEIGYVRITSDRGVNQAFL